MNPVPHREESQTKPVQASPEQQRNSRKVHNRILAVMSHVPWYSFRSQARLARDLSFSKSAVSRLLREECSPSLALACAVTRTLEQRLGKPLDVRELFSLDGTYPTPSACHLVGCSNCLPSAAYDENDNLRPEYRDVAAGAWSISPLQSAARPNDADSLLKRVATTTHQAARRPEVR